MSLPGFKKKHTMQTKVSSTSIEVYHKPEVQASISNQRERVARRVIEQTKAGKPSCIASLYDHFNMTGDKALSQKSSVSRACNEIGFHCDEWGFIEVDGRKYGFEQVAPRKYNGHTVKHFCLVLQSESTGVQTSLFQ